MVTVKHVLFVLVSGAPVHRRTVDGVMSYMFDVKALVNRFQSAAAEIVATKQQTAAGYPNPNSNMNSDLSYPTTQNSTTDPPKCTQAPCPTNYSTIKT